MASRTPMPSPARNDIAAIRSGSRNPTVASLVWLPVKRARRGWLGNWATAGAALALTLILAGCTGGQTEATRSPPPTPVSTSTSSTHSSAATAGYLRDCASSVGGELRSKVIRQVAKAGPLAFVWVRAAERAPAKWFRRRAGGFPSGKYLVLVKNGQQVTVSVPAFEQKTVALLYDPAHFAPFLAVAQGERTVTFR